MKKNEKKNDVEHLIEETLEAALRDEDLREELLKENSEGLKIIELKKKVKFGSKNKSKRALEVRKGGKKIEMSNEQAKFFLEDEEREIEDSCCGGSCQNVEKGKKISKKSRGLSKKEILDIINTVIDPEVGVGIVDMGLIYDVENKNGNLEIIMTLTSMGCPVGPQLVSEVEDVLKTIGGAKSVKVNLTFEPPWSLDMMNQEVRTMIWGSNSE